MISSLKFKSLVHFKLIFVCGVREGSSLTVSHVAVQPSQHQSLKSLSVPRCVTLGCCVVNELTQRPPFVSGLSSLFH